MSVREAVTVSEWEETRVRPDPRECAVAVPASGVVFIAGLSSCWCFN